MTTALLERFEYLTWRLAAEPTQDRMDFLLDWVVANGTELSKADALTPQDARDNQEAPPLTDVLVTTPTPEDAEDSSQDRLDVPDELRCSKCDAYKPVGQFSRDKTSYRGYRYVCKACDAAHRKARRARQREEQQAVSLAS